MLPIALLCICVERTGFKERSSYLKMFSVPVRCNSCKRNFQVEFDERESRSYFAKVACDHCGKNSLFGTVRKNYIRLHKIKINSLTQTKSEKIEPKTKKRSFIPKRSSPHALHEAELSIRKWFLTICHDLCLSPDHFILILSDYIDSGYNTPAAGSLQQIGNKKFKVNILISASNTQNDYRWILSHEMRHAWQFYNHIAATEQDCNNYANSFCERFCSPDCGNYADNIIYDPPVAPTSAGENFLATVIVLLAVFFLILIIKASLSNW